MRIKRSLSYCLAGFAISCFCVQVLATSPVGTAFVYQGRLTASNAPASGPYDFQFTLYDSLTGGNVVGSTVEVDALAVSNGLFTTSIDFGITPYKDNALWLGIAVRTNGGSTFAGLAPRQPVTPTPLAISAQIVPATGVQGTLAQTNLAADVALLDRATQVFSGQNRFPANVGINTGNPDRPLSIGETGANGDWVSLQNGSGTTLWYMNNSLNGLNFGQIGGADYRLFLSANNGYVGIGTGSPTNSLTVNGTVGLVNPNNEDLAVGSPERLRIIRGIFYPAGQVADGSGFNVVSNGVGLYTVNFVPPFSSPPTVTATPVSAIASFATIPNLFSNYVQLGIYNNSGVHSVPLVINFIAIGPP